ncbi:MAG: geranylgeranylglyceryl/heptaprenylglyceryl phosphate synthase [Luteibaculum sp.]
MPGHVTTLKSSIPKKAFAVLIDPEKEQNEENLSRKCQQINNSKAALVLVGASSSTEANCKWVSAQLKENCAVPIIGFPGSAKQINSFWDGLLFLSLISGNNEHYRFTEQLLGTENILEENLELNIYPTGYLLLNGGKHSSAAKASASEPISTDNWIEIRNRVMTAQYLGMTHLYLEAGSGAKNPVPFELVEQLRRLYEGYIIVGGGIKNKDTATGLWAAGADLLVCGNGFEEDETLLEVLGQALEQEILNP